MPVRDGRMDGRTTSGRTHCCLMSISVGLCSIITTFFSFFLRPNKINRSDSCCKKCQCHLCLFFAADKWRLTLPQHVQENRFKISFVKTGSMSSVYYLVLATCIYCRDVKFIFINIRSSFATTRILFKVRKWPWRCCIVKTTA